MTKVCDYKLDSTDERLFCDDTPIQISKKAFKLLELFVGRPERLLTKSQILDELWKDVHVTEGMVKEYVHELRAALKDNAHAPQFIQTVHGRGYRFLGGIDIVVENDGATGLPISDKPSIAVLPFMNQAGVREEDYFCDGLCDEITTSLSLVPWLFVIARNSSRAFNNESPDLQEVGELLGVRYVLGGSVRRSSKTLRVHAELAETEFGALVWAQRFEAKSSDIFALQDEITLAVVNAIGPKIQLAEIDRAARKPPSDLTAYDQLLKARAALNSGNVEQATVMLDAALETDSEYTMAKALKAWSVTLIGWKFKHLTDLEISDALQLANNVLESTDCGIEARAIAAYTIGFFGVDVGHARHILQQVTQEAPSFAWAWASLALLESYHGAPDEAISSANTALALNPRDPQSFRCEMAICKARLVLEDYQQCLFYSDLGLQKSPQNAYFQMCRITCLVQLGRKLDAQAIGARFRLQHPDFKISAWRNLAVNWLTWKKTVNVVAASLRSVKIPE